MSRNIIFQTWLMLTAVFWRWDERTGQDRTGQKRERFGLKKGLTSQGFKISGYFILPTDRQQMYCSHSFGLGGIWAYICITTIYWSNLHAIDNDWSHRYFLTLTVFKYINWLISNKTHQLFKGFTIWFHFIDLIFELVQKKNFP